jgi:hypothetical protein
MKNFLLSLFLLSVVSVSAQYTITSASSPSVGDIESSIETNTAGLTMPTSGTNQFWNYTNIVINPTVSAYSSTYVAVSPAPNATLFPTASIAAKNMGGTYDMYKYNSSVWEYLGNAAITASDCSVYSNPFSLLTLPFAYGNSHADNFLSTTSQYSLSGSNVTLADGTGTLAVPGATFTNVLKIKMTYNASYNFGGSVTTMTAVNHMFFGSASKFTLLSIGSTTQTSNGVTSTYVHAATNNMVIPSAIRENKIGDAVTMYPNPAVGTDLYFNVSTRYNLTVTLFNALGERVMETTLIEGINKIDIGHLAGGIYTVKINSDAGEVTKKLMIN